MTGTVSESVLSAVLWMIPDWEVWFIWKVRAAIQRDPHGLKEWLIGISWSSEDVDVLYVGWNCPCQSVDCTLTGSKAALPKITSGSWWATAVPELAVFSCSKESPPCTEFSKQEGSQQSGMILPLHSALVRWTVSSMSVSFTVRAVKCWNKVPRGLWTSPSQILKTRLNKTLNILIL